MQRSKLIAATRNLPRNFAVAAWAIRKHLDYVSTFSFQATSGDDEVDDRLEQLIAWRSRKENCDVGRRHTLRRLTRLWEGCRTLDGDVLVSRLATGHLQTFESDRLRDPVGAVGIDMERVANGVEIDPLTGAAVRYHISDRKLKSDTMTYTGAVDARFADLLAYYTRIDQVRGVSPMAPAINTFQDVYENFDYALAKAKVAQLFALAIYRTGQDAGSLNNGGLGPNPEPAVDGSEEEPRYNYDFAGGPFVMNLDPGDDAKVIESEQPSTQFQEFTTTMVGIGLKALDIPLIFYDEARANFNSGRQGWILYEQSATSKRGDTREVLDNNTAFWTAQWVLDGTLQLPAGMRFNDLSWRWNHAGQPWMDPLKEITADIASVKAGMNSRTILMQERGLNYYDIIDQLAKEQEYAESKGVNLGEDAMDLAAMARTSMAENTKDAQNQ